MHPPAPPTPTGLDSVPHATAHSNYYGSTMVVHNVIHVGVAPRRYTACSLVNVTNVGGVTIPYEEIPPGLFPLGPGLCGFGRDPW